jgi:transaldolase
MQFFVDTANMAEIRPIAASGLLDGVTTNASFVAETGKKFADAIGDMLPTAHAPINAGVAATDLDGMVAGAPVWLLASSLVEQAKTRQEID